MHLLQHALREVSEACDALLFTCRHGGASNALTASLGALVEQLRLRNLDVLLFVLLLTSFVDN